MTAAPISGWKGTEETLDLPGVIHSLRAHRYDAGQVSLEVWTPFAGERPINCYMSPQDRRALAKFLMQDLTGDPWINERSTT